MFILKCLDSIYNYIYLYMSIHIYIYDYWKSSSSTMRLRIAIVAYIELLPVFSVQTSVTFAASFCLHPGMFSSAESPSRRVNVKRWWIVATFADESLTGAGAESISKEDKQLLFMLGSAFISLTLCCNLFGFGLKVSCLEDTLIVDFVGGFSWEDQQLHGRVWLGRLWRIHLCRAAQLDRFV